MFMATRALLILKKVVCTSPLLYVVSVGSLVRSLTRSRVVCRLNGNSLLCRVVIMLFVVAFVRILQAELLITRYLLGPCFSPLTAKWQTLGLGPSWANLRLSMT